MIIDCVELGCVFSAIREMPKDTSNPPRRV